MMGMGCCWDRQPLSLCGAWGAAHEGQDALAGQDRTGRAASRPHARTPISLGCSWVQATLGTRQVEMAVGTESPSSALQAC